jgi:Ulp1 family protease
LEDTFSKHVIPAFETWLREEAISKEKTSLEELCGDGQQFIHEVVAGLPQQDNCVDCGIYTCMNMFNVIFDVDDYVCNPTTADKCRLVMGADILRGNINLGEMK